MKNLSRRPLSWSGTILYRFVARSQSNIELATTGSPGLPAGSVVMKQGRQACGYDTDRAVRR
jgi:hypothetical protein